MHKCKCCSICVTIALLDGIDVGPAKWSVCGRGLNQLVQEGMNDISKVKIHLKM